MLAAILLVLFMHFSGGGNVLSTMMSKHVTDEVKRNIPDEERRTMALKGLGMVNDDIKKLNEQLSQDLGRMKKLIKDYDSTPEDFDRMFSSVMAKRQELVDRIWEDRTAMLQHVKPEEWQAIMAGARAAMEKETAARQ